MIVIFDKNLSISDDEVNEVFFLINKKVDNNLEKFKCHFPSPAAKDCVYYRIKNDYWTSSFWTGILWLIYENTLDNKYIDILNKQLITYDERLKKKINIETHDLGFLFTLSCVAAFKINNDNYARGLALEAAELLICRYQKKAKIIQAWGSSFDKNLSGRMIIDCLMNLPLLYWSSLQEGNYKYKEVAVNHTYQAMKYLVRDNYSTFHTFYFNTETGEPIKGSTAQGYSDNSSWARGQAWAIYGFVLGYRYTKKKEFLDTSVNTANYFIDKLPEDFVCYWDLIFTDGEEERDSSAAAIAACGLLELSKYLTDKDLVLYYENVSKSIFNSLTVNYIDKDELKLGILKHSVYSKPDNKGIDECTIWGDYFYLELLTRFKKDWKSYW